MDEQQNQQPVNNAAPVMEPQKKSFGPMIGIIIIIILFALGAWYFFAESQNEVTLPEVSSSDEVNAIEEDLSLEPMDNSSFENELQSIEAELDAEIEAAGQLQ